MKQSKKNTQETTDNFKKHTTSSFLQRKLIDNFFRVLVSELREANPKSILDVGCGEGFTLNRLMEDGIGTSYEGIEYLDRSIMLGKKLHPHLDIKKGDIYKLPYKDNSFDLVLCTEVLEHLEDPKAALSELVRVTSRYCFLSVPNEPFFMLGNLLRGKNVSRWGNDIEHIQHWTSVGFQKFVTEAGLAVVKKRTPLPWTMILAKKQ